MTKSFGVFEPTACIIALGLIFFASSNVFSFPYKGLELKINITTSETYDDNIDYNQENEKEDLVTRLRAAITAEYEGKSALLGLRGYADHSVYARYNERDATSGGLALTFEKDLSKYDHFGVHHEFLKTFEPGSFEDEFGRTVSRSKRTNNQFTANYSREISQNLKGSSQYSVSIDHIPDIDRGDTVKNLFSVTSSYAFSAATMLYASYEFSDTRTEDGPTFKANSVFAGIRRNVSKALALNLFAGLDFIDSQVDDINTQGTDEYLKASVTGDFKTGGLNISLSKRTDTSGYRQELFDKWEASLDFTHDLTSKLRGSASGFWGTGTFQSSDVQEVLFGAEVTVRYEFNDHVSGALGYLYSRRVTDDNDQIPGYTRNSIVTTIDASF